MVATEDSRFSQTPGIEPVSVVRLGLATLTGSNDTGAAALEQQLAKNLYYPQDDGVLSKVAETRTEYDPLHHLPAGPLRQRHVLDRLVATGVLSVAQADAAFAAPLGLH